MLKLSFTPDRAQGGVPLSCSSLSQNASNFDLNKRCCCFVVDKWSLCMLLNFLHQSNTKRLWIEFKVTLHLSSSPSWLAEYISFVFLQASTPYSLESDNLGMDCIISGSASPTLAINTVTNKVPFSPGCVSPITADTSVLHTKFILNFFGHDYRRAFQNRTDVWCFCLHGRWENWRWVSSILGWRYMHKSS